MPIDSSVLNCSDNIDVHGSLFSNVRKIWDSRRGYLLAHFNNNGLVSKVDQIRLLLQYCSVDILALGETKLDESICSGLVSVRGYDPRGQIALAIVLECVYIFLSIYVVQKFLLFNIISQVLENWKVFLLKWSFVVEKDLLLAVCIVHLRRVL